MRDKYIFSDGQDLTGLNSTGVVSTNVWNLEEDWSANALETDSQVVGWLNVILRAANAGGDEGLWIEMRSEDEANLNWDSQAAGEIGTGTDQVCLGAILISQPQLIAGAAFAIGVSRASLGTFVGIWYRAASTALAGTATPIDAWWSVTPEGLPVIQKKPS